MKYTVKYKCVDTSGSFFGTVPALIIKYRSDNGGLLCTRHKWDVDWFAYKMHYDDYRSHYGSLRLTDYCNETRETRIRLLRDVINSHYEGSIDTYIMEFAKYLIISDMIDENCKTEYEKELNTILFKKWRTRTVDIDFEDQEEKIK